MSEIKSKIYICTNVASDQFSFLGKAISEAGFIVEDIYLVNESDYRRLARGSGFKKLWLRILMYVAYPLYLLFRIITCSQSSIFVVISNPFFAPYFAQFFLRFKQGKVIHLLYDLFPDALEIAGSINEKNLLSKLIGRLMSQSQAKCAATVYLGNFLKMHAEKRWGTAKYSEVIDISTDVTSYTNAFEPVIDGDKLIIHYGGQLGYLHDAESLVNSIKYVCQSDIGSNIEFNFYVSGAQAFFLESSLRGFPVKVVSAVPSHQWRAAARHFHVGLVSLSPGGATVCLPSKTYGMMAVGMAILAICPVWSDLAALIKNLDAGWIVNNSFHTEMDSLQGGDYLQRIKKKNSEKILYKNFYQTIKKILEAKDILKQKRSNAYYGMRRCFGLESLSAKWGKIIKDVHNYA